MLGDVFVYLRFRAVQERTDDRAVMLAHPREAFQPAAAEDVHEQRLRAVVCVMRGEYRDGPAFQYQPDEQRRAEIARGRFFADAPFAGETRHVALLGDQPQAVLCAILRDERRIAFRLFPAYAVLDVDHHYAGSVRESAIRQRGEQAHGIAAAADGDGHVARGRQMRVQHRAHFTDQCVHFSPWKSSWELPWLWRCREDGSR